VNCTGVNGNLQVNPQLLADYRLGASDTALPDAELPAPGQGFGYLVTAENGAGSEGTLGYASAAERSNFGPCP
jgi:hypothetical protein